MQELLHIFHQVQPLSTEEEVALLSNWHKAKSLRRNDFLISVGQTDQHLYLIRQGTLRIYLPMEENEVVVGFGYENTLICAFPSFIQQQPSDYAIQALTKSELIGITRTDFLRLLADFPKLEHAWRLMVEQALVGRIQREVDLLTQSPKDRIDRLLERSPHIFQLIPHKYLASYLRMTPETFSRQLNG